MSNSIKIFYKDKDKDGKEDFCYGTPSQLDAIKKSLKDKGKEFTRTEKHEAMKKTRSDIIEARFEALQNEKSITDDPKYKQLVAEKEAAKKELDAAKASGDKAKISSAKKKYDAANQAQHDAEYGESLDEEFHYGEGEHPEHGPVEVKYKVKAGVKPGEAKPEHIQVHSGGLKDDVHIEHGEMEHEDQKHFAKIAAAHYNKG